MSPQFLAPAGSFPAEQQAAPPPAAWLGGAHQPLVAANGLQPGDLVRFKGQVVNRQYEGKTLTVETADVGDGSGRARVVVQHENGQVARLAIDPSFLELLPTTVPEVASPVIYQTVVAGASTYAQGLGGEPVASPVTYQTVMAGGANAVYEAAPASYEPVNYQTVMASEPISASPATYQTVMAGEPISASPATYQTILPAGAMYEPCAPAPATYQTVMPAVPAVNAMVPNGPSMTTNASYLPPPAYTAAGAYGANPTFGTTTPPSVYAAPAPTYGTGAATTIAAGPGEVGMAAAGGWSYAPPPMTAYGAGAGAPIQPIQSTTYGNPAATYAPPPMYGAAEPMVAASGGWSYAPPPLGAAAPYPVA
jgi:hypothetical protein